MSFYNINNKLICGSYGLITACESYTPPEPPPSLDEIVIGTQTWLAKNLNVDDGGDGITIVENVSANGVNFGTQYYYTWDAAVRVANSIEGWHLPTTSEWNTLITYCGISNAGTKLKSTSGWNMGNGTDDYGFNVLPAGYFSNSLSNVGLEANFWTKGELSVNDKYFEQFSTWNAGVSLAGGSKTMGYSVRLVKD